MGRRDKRGLGEVKARGHSSITRSLPVESIKDATHPIACISILRRRPTANHRAATRLALAPLICRAQHNID